jgi:hypothetical protein
MKRRTIEAIIPMSIKQIENRVKKQIGKHAKCPDIDALFDSMADKICGGIKMMVKAYLWRKNIPVQVKKVSYLYKDSYVTHGIAYFKVKLSGNEKTLKSIAGEDKIFIYDWKEKNDHKKTLKAITIKN